MLVIVHCGGVESQNDESFVQIYMDLTLNASFNPRMSEKREKNKETMKWCSRTNKQTLLVTTGEWTKLTLTF